MKTDIICPLCKKGTLVMTEFREEGAREGFRDNVAIDCSTSEDVGGTGSCEFIQSYYCKLTPEFIENRRQEHSQ